MSRLSDPKPFVGDDNEDIQRQARAYVIWLLARRDYSRPQLERKLRDRDVSVSEIRLLLDALVEEGYFREKNYQKARTRQLLKKGLGANVVKAKLRAEKCTVSDDDITTAFAEIGTDANTELRELVAKALRKWERRSGVSERDIRQKVIKAMAAKGHRASDVIKVLEALAAEP